jgi:hypothetical protein
VASIPTRLDSPRALLATALLLLLFVAVACSRTPQARLEQAFDVRIPAAERARYAHVHDAKDWRNPFLVVGPASVLIISSAATRPGTSNPTAIRREIEVRPELVERYLLTIPDSAWPYGRVVAVQQSGVVAPGTDQAIKTNLHTVQQTCTKLHIVVEPWPSA